MNGVGASLLFNGAPVAVLQILSMCKWLALQRIRGDLENMFRWYQAALVAVSYRMEEQRHISMAECEALLHLLALPKNLLKGPQKTLPPAQIWSVFRTGVVFGCGTFVYSESLRAQSLNPDVHTHARVDLSQLSADPRLLDQLRSNLDYVFQCLDEQGLPRIWTVSSFLTYPDDDDTFLLIQAYALYQTFSHAVPLLKLEQRVTVALAGVDEITLQQPLDKRKIWAQDSNAAAFKDIKRILGKEGKATSTALSTWRQAQKNSALPVLVVSIAAMNLAAAKTNVPQNAFDGKQRRKGVREVRIL